MSAPAPRFHGKHTDYIAKALWHETRLTRVLLCVNQATGDDAIVKVSRRRTVFDRSESAFHESFADFFGSGAAQCLVEHEAFALKRLDNPRVVRLIDYGLFDELRFTVTARVPGEMLREYTRSPWPAARAKDLTSELLSALEHLRERRTTHRDLRPENIIVRNPVGPTLTVIDFELAAVDGHFVPGRVGDSRYRDRAAAQRPVAAVTRGRSRSGSVHRGPSADRGHVRALAAVEPVGGVVGALDDDHAHSRASAQNWNRPGWVVQAPPCASSTSIFEMGRPTKWLIVRPRG